MQRKRLDSNPKMSYPTAHPPRAGHCLIVKGRARNQGLGMSLAKRNHSLHLREIVLPVSIDLQRMREARRGCEFDALHHGRAFAAIYSYPVYGHLIRWCMKRRQGYPMGIVTAVVDDEDVKTVTAQFMGYFADNRAVIVTWNDRAAAEIHMGSNPIRPDEKVPLESA
jgi:hypothetical protein